MLSLPSLLVRFLQHSSLKGVDRSANIKKDEIEKQLEKRKLEINNKIQELRAKRRRRST